MSDDLSKRVKATCNTSQTTKDNAILHVTGEVQRERGTRSRVTVRKRVPELAEEGIVEEAEGHSYRLKE
jgi:hypothetical protein